MHDIGPERVVAVIPFYPHGSETESVATLHQTLERAPTGYEIYVVDDGSDLLDGDGYNLISLPGNMGKIEAVRAGISQALEVEGVDGIIVSDFDDEQEIADAPLIVEGLEAADVVIGNRYGLVDEADMPPHRLAVNRMQSAVARSLGFEATDIVSGLLGCRADFASDFLSRTNGMQLAGGNVGIGVVWSIVASLNNSSLINTPVRAQMRSDQTAGDKIAGQFQPFIAFSDELAAAGREATVDFCKELRRLLKAGQAEFIVPTDILGDTKTILASLNDTGYSFRIAG